MVDRYCLGAPFFFLFFLFFLSWDSCSVSLSISLSLQVLTFDVFLCDDLKKEFLHLFSFLSCDG